MAYTYYTETQLSGTWHYGRMAIQVNSQNQANNTSNITVIMQVRERVNASSYNLVGTANFWIKVNGGVVTSKTTFDWRTLTTTYKTEMTWTGDVTHNANGTLSISIQGYMFTNVGAGTWSPAAITGIAMPTIPRESTFGAVNLSSFEYGFTTTFNHYTGYDQYHIYVGSTFICARTGVTSGGTITFTAAEQQAIYAAGQADSINVTFYLGTFTTTAYTTQIGSWKSLVKAGQFVGNTLSAWTYNGLENPISLSHNGLNTWCYNVLQILVNGTLRKSFDNYVSGTVVSLTDSEILAIYAILAGETPEMNPQIDIQLSCYGASNKTHLLGYSGGNGGTPTTGSIWQKIPSVGWKKCVPYIKVAGVWEKCLASQQVSGAWKRGI